MDALRGIAALAVAVHHLASIYHLPPPLPLNPFIAVDVFFILSGFVMARTYEDRLRNGLATLAFIKLRYRRLFLPLAVGSTIGFGLAVAIYGPTVQLVAAYVLILSFLPAIGPSAFLLNVPAWSLFVEIICNSLHGAIFARMSNARLLALIGACGLLFAACFATGVSLWGPGVTSILSLIPRELTCYLVGIWMFRRYGDAPLGGNPASMVTDPGTIRSPMS
ncbi:acyltransferase family protein [Mesorhizobium sp. IMUNJ 23033]|uniref:acyltransferase family protein n=1 Tax=Mesorhizobium sp. IMUNJ 23033 TaxID=3378039 RepID=UPI00384E8B32